MRKTFVVGRLTGSSSHILLVDTDGAAATSPVVQPREIRCPPIAFAHRLSDPLTVH